jgi:signal transduction histidine kinase/ActR/RegA family two-component response regulator
MTGPDSTSTPAPLRDSAAQSLPWLAGLHERVLALEGQSVDLQPVLEVMANALTKAGFAPERLSVSILTRHPGLSGLAYIWSRVQPRVAFLERPPGFLDSEEHLASPLHHVLTTRSSLFIDQQALPVDPRFPIVREFAQFGATSYLALPLFAARGDVHVLALLTTRQGGWSDADAAQLARVVPLLTLLIEVTENRRLLGMIGTAHELTQRALAEQALRSADEQVRQQAADMARQEIERQARLAIEQQLQQRSRDLAERNAQLRELTASLEAMVSTRTRDLEEALAQANAATLAKSRFLAMMSHEIRTPMHGVLGLGELLAKTTLDAEQAGYVATMQSTGLALLTVLNGILDFSQVEANRIELETVALDPARLLDDVVMLSRRAADTQGLWLKLACADDVPQAVLGDPTRLRQVWINLIGNAVKFTQRGGVSVALDVVARDAETVSLRGTVTDTGVGIAPEVIAQLWEPFSQGDSSTARRFGGSGLGLSISRGLVEQMGGSLTVSSRLGEGSIFTFVVPLAVAADEPAPMPETGIGPAVDLSGLRILVVDDNPVNRLVIERQLVKLGARAPVLADSGSQALASLARQGFDIVLMDMQMPDMDGLETTRLLRNRPDGKQTRVIGMSANAYPEDRLACLAAGMNDFVSKPVSMATLQAVLGAEDARPWDASLPGYPAPTR